MIYTIYKILRWKKPREADVKVIGFVIAKDASFIKQSRLDIFAYPSVEHRRRDKLVNQIRRMK